MVSKYVLAGGPCSGKTDGMKYLKKSLSEKGYKIYTISETATELIESGLDRNSPDFPYCNFSLMLYKELLFSERAKEQNEDAVILCDRGRMDAKAYRGNEVFQDILKRYNFSEKDVLDSYDAVFFLKSTADGLEEEYKKDSVRTEDIEQAKLIQSKLFNVWSEHPNFILINNTPDFSKKLFVLEDRIININRSKTKDNITAQELIRFADGLAISDAEMLRIVGGILKDRNIDIQH